MLALVDVTDDGPVTVSRTELFDSRAWTAPTRIGDTLFVRNTEEIVALDLSSRRTG